MAATIPRELLKWIQSLDLTWTVKNAKWDLSNGYLIAEIFSWYYPREVQMTLYHNVSSLKLKLGNWYHLKKFMKQKDIVFADEFIDGVIHCKEGAALLLLQTLYELLTNRELKVIPADPEIDFTDHGYQSQLPDHARSTAVQAIRSNLKGSELAVITSIVKRRQLAQDIMNRHTEDRARARSNNPQRYGHKPTLGELAARRPPPPEYSGTISSVETTQSCSHSLDGEGDGYHINDDDFEPKRSACSLTSVKFQDTKGFWSTDSGDSQQVGAGDYITTKNY